MAGITGNVSGELPGSADGRRHGIERGSLRGTEQGGRYLRQKSTSYVPSSDTLGMEDCPEASSFIVPRTLPCHIFFNTFFCDYSLSPCLHTNFSCHPTVSLLIEKPKIQPGVIAAGASLVV